MVSEFSSLFAEQSNRVGGVSAEQKIGFPSKWRRLVSRRASNLGARCQTVSLSEFEVSRRELIHKPLPKINTHNLNPYRFEMKLCDFGKAEEGKGASELWF